MFCADAEAPGCAALDTCGLGSVDAGNCDLLPAYLFGCQGGVNDTQIQAGLELFDGTQGQLCLDALTAAGSACTPAAYATVASACGSGLVNPGVAQGHVCQLDQDCIPPVFPDGGTIVPSTGSVAAAASVGSGSIFGPLFGCDTRTQSSSFVCGGVCSYGHAVGELCSNIGDGSGCAQGYCSQGALVDGGLADVCIAYATAGQSCETSSCDPSLLCLGIADGGYACSGYADAGAGCNVTDCADGSCNCDLGLVCLGPADGGVTGVCAVPNTGGGPCQVDTCQYTGGTCACDGNHAYCASVDGGNFGVCTPQGDAGTLCSPAFCPNDPWACSCYPGMFCETPPDGGLVDYYCTAKVGAGGACIWSSCTYEGEQWCQCDSTDLYCPTSTQVCTARGGELQGCNPNDYIPCQDGFVCGYTSDECYPSAPSGVGDPCSPEEGSSCTGSLICSSSLEGTCITSAVALGQACNPSASPPDCDGLACSIVSDGGFVCQPNLGAGQDCSLGNCDELLDCDSVTLSDGGVGSVCMPVSTQDAGAPCDPNDLGACVVGYCDPTALTCLPYLPTGTSCAGLPSNACGPFDACGGPNEICTPSCEIIISSDNR